jgi:PHD/YefM family antitoxin component YafN of YafNO toxin-antitoxin module
MVGDLMKKMAGVFKVHCLAVTGEVQSKRETVVITERGQPAAQLIPADKDKDMDDIYNFLAGRGAITGDV